MSNQDELFEQRIKEIEKKLEEKEKIIEQQQDEINRLEGQRKLGLSEIEKQLRSDLEFIHRFISADCLEVCKKLKSLYVAEPSNKFKRRSLQLALLGIVWTEAIRNRSLPNAILAPSTGEIVEPTIDLHIDLILPRIVILVVS